VACWGSDELGGAIHLAPIDVQGLNDATAISARSQSSCAAREAVVSSCWGFNAHGQHGDGTTTTDPSLVPVDALGLNDAIAVSAGEYHTCALRQNGQVNCWGTNTWGQLGDGTTTNHYAPAPMIGLPSDSDQRAVAAGGAHISQEGGSPAVVATWRASGLRWTSNATRGSRAGALCGVLRPGLIPAPALEFAPEQQSDPPKSFEKRMRNFYETWPQFGRRDDFERGCPYSMLSACLILRIRAKTGDCPVTAWPARSTSARLVALAVRHPSD
jgi:Regulator of Chromosome Condensation (RCC1) repeat protein